MKKFSIKVFLVSMILVNIVSTLVFMNKADAKKVAFKKYTNFISVSIKNGKAKSVNLSKKLKKGDKLITKKKVTKDGVITIKKTSAKKVKVSVSGAKSNKTVAVKFRTKKNGTITIWVKITGKVNDGDNPGDKSGKKKATYSSTYSGHTFTFSSASEKGYFDKIIAELQPQMKDPDKANKEIYGKTFKPNVPFERKQRNILARYLWSHADYSLENKGSFYTNTAWKRFYEGTFEGACGDGGYAGCWIALALGFNARYVACIGVNHGWLVIEAVDASGVTYWEGVGVTAYARNLAFNQPMTKTNEYRYDINGVTSYSQLQLYTPDYNWK